MNGDYTFCAQRADTGACLCSSGCAAKQLEEMRISRDRAEAELKALKNAPATQRATHEERWKVGEGPLAGALYVGEMWIGSFTSANRARLAKEAPRLARRLLGTGYAIPTATGSEWHTHECVEYGHNSDCEDARSLLKDCGALP